MFIFFHLSFSFITVFSVFASYYFKLEGNKDFLFIFYLTELAGHAYGTVHVIVPWSEEVAGSAIKFLMLKSDQVMKTTRISPAK